MACMPLLSWLHYFYIVRDILLQLRQAVPHYLTKSRQSSPHAGLETQLLDGFRFWSSQQLMLNITITISSIKHTKYLSEPHLATLTS